MIRPWVLAVTSLLTACSEGAVEVRADSYDQSCERASDCVLVPVGDVCDRCAGSHLGPIGSSELPRYRSDVEALGCGDDGGDAPSACAPLPRLRPVCNAGACTTEASSCGDGVCDHYPWDGRETAVSCPDDCRCGDGVCDATELSGAGACSRDCPTTSR